MKATSLVSISMVVTASAFAPPSIPRRASSVLRYISHNFEDPYGYHGPMAGGGPHLDVLDMNISEESILKHYQEWCKKFHRKQDNFRFIVFQRNYLSQFKWNLAAGKQAFTLNEYADCTEEEYQQLRKKAGQHVVNNGPSLPQAAEAFEVSVVRDEEDVYHQEGLNSVQYLDAVDVEVVNHSPFLAGF